MAERVMSPIEREVGEVFERVRGIGGGRLASYIPELGKADEEAFGLAVCTADGFTAGLGDADQEFTIQSISKPFVYGLALATHGREDVDAYIDVEPSGEAYNELSVHPETGRPLNAMINAGAIAASSLVPGRTVEERIDAVVSLLSSYAGRQLELDQGVLDSETQSSYRNRAIAYMLRAHDMIACDPDEALAVYLAQCAVKVTCKDLAAMGAVLANGGVQPRTGEPILEPDVLRRMLSVMATCGMYDGAGNWLTDVGMPAKSGVSGGIMGVLPGQLALAVFSPMLNDHGNSVRGVAAFTELSREFGLHIFDRPRGTTRTLRRQIPLAKAEELDPGLAQALQEQEDATLYVLQGDIHVAGLQSLAEAMAEEPESTAKLVIDTSEAGAITEQAKDEIRRLAEHYVSPDREVLVVDADPQDRELAESVGMKAFPTLDEAAAWCAGEDPGT